MKKAIVMGILTLCLQPCLAQFIGTGCLYESTGFVGIGLGACPAHNLVVRNVGTSSGTNVLFGATTMKGFNATLGASTLEIQAQKWAALQFIANATATTHDLLEMGTNGGMHFIYATATGTAVKPLQVQMFNGTGVSKNMTFWPNGSVGVGTDLTNLNSTKFAVRGLIACHELKVVAPSASWPDFVFSSEFKRMSLSDIAKYIKQNKHLPQLPSAEEIEKEGHNVGKTQAQILQALEELYLHVIDLKNENEALKAKIASLEN
jgi:hypothetical protein